MAAPTVTSLDPDNGNALGGDEVDITGTNLTGATSVTFDDTEAWDVVVVSATHITCRVPANVVGGVTHVRVTTPDGTSAEAVGNEYEYTGTYVQEDGTPDETYFMNVALTPDKLADGGLLHRLDIKRYPQVGIIYPGAGESDGSA